MTSVMDRLREEKAAYAEEARRQGEDRPLGGYLAVMGVYAGAVASAVGVAAVRGKRLPERVSPWDVTLMSLATHKLSRLITKDSITSPLRAPFTRYQGVSGPAELAEEVRHDSGVRHSLGELLTCPFCLGMWVATGLTAGTVFAPRLTRLANKTLTTVTVSDFLQLVYPKAEQSAQG